MLTLNKTTGTLHTGGTREGVSSLQSVRYVRIDQASPVTTHPPTPSGEAAGPEIYTRGVEEWPAVREDDF